MAAPSGMIEKYGLLYPKGHSVLAIELECYRTNRQPKDGGLGAFRHFRNAWQTDEITSDKQWVDALWNSVQG